MMIDQTISHYRILTQLGSGGEIALSSVGSLRNPALPTRWRAPRTKASGATLTLLLARS
jgi:hypothetical protein